MSCFSTIVVMRKKLLKEMLDGKNKPKIFSSNISSNMVQQCWMKCWIPFPEPLLFLIISFRIYIYFTL